MISIASRPTLASLLLLAVLCAAPAASAPAAAASAPTPADGARPGISLAPAAGRIASAALDREPVRSRLAAVNGELECNIIDFEGYGDDEPIGTVPGDIQVTFASSWRAIVDHDAGGIGNFANEPSPNTTAYVPTGAAGPINFSQGVQFVEIFYVASELSVPVKLTAWSGSNGTGTIIDEAFGTTVGLDLDDAPCSGDPNGNYCLWATITLVSPTNNIRSITISGAVENDLGFDDMTFCNTPPVTLEVGPEEGFVPATVRPEGPRVIFGPDGGKAVVWFQLGNGGTVICVQFFDENGRPITQPLLVNALPGNNRTPTAAFDDRGRLRILWTRDEGVSALAGDRLGLAAVQGSSVVGRTFDPSGQPQSGETTVSTGAAGESAQPETDSDLAGNSVVVWQDGGKIRARLLDADGNPRSDVFDVNAGVTGLDPALAVSASGDFVVAWEGLNAGIPAIIVRRFRDDGAPQGGAQVVSTAGSPAHPALAIDQAGNFIVAWDATGASGRDIFTQRYRANGETQGSVRQANANASGDQTHPRVDVNSKGRFAVVWESTEGAPGNAATLLQGQSVVGRVFDPQGEPERVEEEVATTESGTTPEKPDVSLDDDDDMAVVYERRGAGGQSEGIFRKDVTILAPAGECIPDQNTLCLSDGRFRVTALWEEPNTRVVSAARAETLTGDTGFFWFFEPDNVEVVVKALAACTVNSRFWVFAAGLTNVEVTLRVDDVVTGQSNTYFNERGDAYLPILDIEAFATCDAATAEEGAARSDAEVAAIRDEVLAGLLTLAVDGPRPAEGTPISFAPAAGTAACATDADSLCVTGNRYLVEVDFRLANGTTGRGQAIQLTNDTGTFWFFEPDNVEIVVKVLNACTFQPGRFWVFAAGLTNVEATLTVLDTQTGTTRVYENPQGQAFVPIQDSNAFATCP
jgi:hypothetical protein